MIPQRRAVGSRRSGKALLEVICDRAATDDMIELGRACLAFRWPDRSGYRRLAAHL